MRTNIGAIVKTVVIAFSTLAIIACNDTRSTQNATPNQAAEESAQFEASEFAEAQKLYEEGQLKKALEARNCDKALAILNRIKHPEQIKEYDKLIKTVQDRHDVINFVSAKQEYKSGNHCYAAASLRDIKNINRFSGAVSMQEETENICDNIHYTRALEAESACGKATHLRQIQNRENFPRFKDTYFSARVACIEECKTRGYMVPKTIQIEQTKPDERLTRTSKSLSNRVFEFLRQAL